MARLALFSPRLLLSIYFSAFTFLKFSKSILKPFSKCDKIKLELVPLALGTTSDLPTTALHTTDFSAQLIHERIKEDTFSRNKNNDAHEHVEQVLDIVNLLNIPGVTHDAVMLRVFPITLTGAAKRWVDRLSLRTVDSWDILKKAFINMYYPPSKTAKQLEDICNFKQEGDKTLYQAWEQYNNLLYKCPTHDINSHQKTIADHSQKWHDGSSSRSINNNSNTEGITAIEPISTKSFLRTKKLRVLKRLNMASSDIPHLSVMEQNIRNQHKRRVKMEEWEKKLKENAEINTRNQSASLKNLETQIKQLTKEFHAKTVSEVNNSALNQCKAVYDDNEAPLNNGINEP
ncbi:hypothetical protein Tco_0709828 [Tanacetum coccineum]